MKINRLIPVIVTILFIGFIAPSVSATYVASEQYGSSDESTERKYTGYFIEDGKLKNTLIIVRFRRLVAYWNGKNWISVASKVEKNKMAKEMDDDASEELKVLATKPLFVTIENKRVYFDDHEN